MQRRITQVAFRPKRRGIDSFSVKALSLRKGARLSDVGCAEDKDQTNEWVTMIAPISHRGFWREPSEQNTEIAFRRSLEHGFGIETDLRDWQGQIFIAHNIADKPKLSLDEFLQLYREFGGGHTLALNIKADGLQSLLASSIERHFVENYFVFDMSVPETLSYGRKNIKYFTRVSEFETVPALYEKSQGVWVDQFESDWVDGEAVQGHLSAGKRVCIVSPELHGRPHAKAWSGYQDMFGGGVPAAGRLFLCTDYPDLAEKVFSS